MSCETWSVIVNEGHVYDAEENAMTLHYVFGDTSAGGDGSGKHWEVRTAGPVSVAETKLLCAAGAPTASP